MSLTLTQCKELIKENELLHGRIDYFEERDFQLMDTIRQLRKAFYVDGTSKHMREAMKLTHKFFNGVKPC